MRRISASEETPHARRPMPRSRTARIMSSVRASAAGQYSSMPSAFNRSSSSGLYARVR